MQKHETSTVAALPAAEPLPLLETIVEAHKHLPPPIDGLVIGILAGFSPEGVPEVSISLSGLPERLTARSLCPVGPERIGTQCALLFEQGNPERPLIMGFLHQAEVPLQTKGQALPEATVDGKRITFEAHDEIVLRCGRASITLTRAGKVLIRGTYLLSRSSGANRIKGGSVQLN